MIRQSGQEICHRGAVWWHFEIRCDLRKWLQIESSLAKPWMGQRQLRLINDKITIDQKIDIEWAWSPALPASSSVELFAGLENC